MTNKLKLFESGEKIELLPQKKIVKPKRFLFSFVAKYRSTKTEFNGSIEADSENQFFVLFKKFYKNTELLRFNEIKNPKLNFKQK
jgi:hypothetical protein